MKVKKYSYRIGTTSYVFPEEILPNVWRLKETVDDIELLFFESESIPSIELMNELKELSQQFGFSYTVHLPLDLRLTDADPGIRRASVDKVIKFIEKAAYLEPYGYILHIDPAPVRRSWVDRNGFLPDLKTEWQKQAGETVKEIMENVSVCPSTICVENLDYPLELLDDIIAEFNLSICLDIGHLLQHKFNIEKYFQKYIDGTRVIHLCGINSSGLHGSLREVEPKIIAWLKKYLDFVQYNGVLTLEVFSESDLEESMELWI